MRDLVVFASLIDKKILERIEIILKTQVYDNIIVYRPKKFKHKITLDENIVNFEYPREIFIKYKILAILNLFFRLLFKKYNNNSILTFNFMPYGILGIIYGLIKRKKIICSFIGSDVNLLTNSKNKYIWKYLLKIPDMNIFTGNNSLKKIKNQYSLSENNIIINNSIMVENIEKIKKPKNFIFVGNLFEIKNIIVIVKAFIKFLNTKLIENENIKPKLFILGEGKLYDAVCEIISNSNTKNEILVKGHVEDVKDYYENSSFLVLYSHNEGLPMVVLEALNNRVLPLVSDVGDLRDILNLEMDK